MRYEFHHNHCAYACRCNPYPLGQRWTSGAMRFWLWYGRDTGAINLEVSPPGEQARVVCLYDTVVLIRRGVITAWQPLRRREQRFLIGRCTDVAAAPHTLLAITPPDLTLITDDLQVIQVPAGLSEDAVFLSESCEGFLIRSGDEVKFVDPDGGVREIPIVRRFLPLIKQNPGDVVFPVRYPMGVLGHYIVYMESGTDIALFFLTEE